MRNVILTNQLGAKPKTLTISKNYSNSTQIQNDGTVKP